MQDVWILEIDNEGTEIYSVANAAYNLYQTDDGVWEWVISVSSGSALQRVPALAEVLDAEPHFEATALLSPDDLAIFAGKVITQAEGYDYERDENLSNIYYFEHDSVEALSMTILAVHDDNSILANVRGRAVVVDTRHGPDTLLRLEAVRFVRDETLYRGVC